MAEQPSRPFYGEYAWAFDLLIDRPVGQDCATIAAWFSELGVRPGATLLDAGCGTGRYAGEFARRAPIAWSPWLSWPTCDVSPPIFSLRRGR